MPSPEPCNEKFVEEVGKATSLLGKYKGTKRDVVISLTSDVEEIHDDKNSALVDGVLNGKEKGTKRRSWNCAWCEKLTRVGPICTWCQNQPPAGWSACEACSHMTTNGKKCLVCEYMERVGPRSDA